ncbi:hypothetical protein ElyMa_005036800 [Elysia marginata]|uniref:Uncharacterized protein n=1 Tax=Elysia marginata TaxID=1093978 RepID=A0AAV4JA01_9GAST|nr:hypothetical protein ElyMa_005036800 [Elysia marginata]
MNSCYWVVSGKKCCHSVSGLWSSISLYRSRDVGLREGGKKHLRNHIKETRQGVSIDEGTELYITRLASVIHCPVYDGPVTSATECMIFFSALSGSAGHCGAATPPELSPEDGMTVTANCPRPCLMRSSKRDHAGSCLVLQSLCLG